jgi:predicted DNA-binding transcriptional regulator AlpA
MNARHDHMGLSEVAALLGVTRQRAHAIVRDYPDFPAPADVLAAGPVWHGEDVRAWHTRHPVRPRGVRLRAPDAQP